MTGGDRWMGTEDAARHLGIVPRTLYRLVNEGEPGTYWLDGC